MRFFADGPIIPDSLLEQRDRGNVVFFCGAGVSVPSGLPGFYDLTVRTMRDLGTAADAKSRSLLERARAAGDDPAFDQVFNLLQQEYRPSQVEHVVCQLLRTPRRARLDTHRIILRLSRNARKLPQVVTTNFDQLFELADKTLQIRVPPALPDLSLLGSFDGIVYLHGRLWVPEISARQFRKFWRFFQKGWPVELMPDLSSGRQVRGVSSASTVRRV